MLSVIRERVSTTWILVGVAGLAGILAFFLSSHYLSAQEARMRAELAGNKTGIVSIVVASKDLFPGATISPETMSMGGIPQAHVSLRMIRPEQFKVVEGRTLSRPVRAGEPLMVDYVAGVTTERFSELLAEGERAVSLEVSELESHAGMLMPGDYVDLFVVIETQGGEAAQEKQRRLLPVLERVKVLAAGPAALRNAEQDYSMLSDEQSKYSAITVGVPIDDAERLLLAREMGTMAYLMRRPNDPSMNVASSMDSADVAAGLPGGSSAAQYRFISASALSGKSMQVLSLDGTQRVALSQPVMASDVSLGIDKGLREPLRSPAAILVDQLYSQHNQPESDPAQVSGRAGGSAASNAGSVSMRTP